MLRNHSNKESDDIQTIEGVLRVRDTKYINIVFDRRRIKIDIGTILYVIMVGRCAEIHVAGGEEYKTRLSMATLQEELGENFIQVHRGCVVSAMAIHDITDNINLCNGESLIYTVRKKKKILEEFHQKQKKMIDSFVGEDNLITQEDYRNYYASFEHLPFAFTDIEMIFNDERHAVDWIFRYGNPALAKLEKLPLQKLIGNSFGSLFSNMDAKWLRSYERVALYGETLEMIDYSPEIDTYLKVICFPTFTGHCGCILFDLSEIEFTENSIDAKKAMKLYFDKTIEEESKRLSK